MLSEKGGVARTTTTLNLAAGLALRGLRVLVIDTDPQGNASHVLLAGEPARSPTVADVLLGEVEALEAIVPSPSFAGVDVLPANHQLGDVAVTLANEVGRERRLRVAIEGLESRYDFVLVDTAPTRSLINTNVMNAVGELFVPVAPSLFGFLGLGQLQSDVAQVRRFLDNRDLAITGIILTMVEKSNVSKELESQLRELFGPVVFKTRVGRSVKLEEAHARHQSIFDYAPSSPGAVAYKALTSEVVGHGGKENGNRVARRHLPKDDAA
jgi:chromosome partitioning protein